MKRTLGLLILVTVAAGVVQAADDELPVKDGLELWLDARSVAGTVAPPGARPLEAARPLAKWPDQTGEGRDLVQSVAEKQPTVQRPVPTLPQAAVVRFDGQDDSLFLAGPAKDYRDLTLFVVAAPKSNLGGFRALLAFNKTGVNDYTSGLTLDMHGFPSFTFSLVNLEGRGFGGAVDVMTDDHPFGTFHVLAATLMPGKAGVKLFVDGKPNGQRDRTDEPLRADELRIGVRHYSNTADPTSDQGFFEGDIAEVLVYDRVLSDAERKEVEKYLAAKHAELLKLAPALARDGKPLVPVKDPPPVEMLVPGFAVREMPIDLTNINNLRYRRDGKLVAMAYDGNAYLMSDTDGDGVEDKAELWWDNSTGSLRSPIGMALTPDDYRHGSGIFVACKGKLVLLTDSDGDDKLDKERIVAEGWQELPHGVDALGVAVAKDGSVFFGLGCAEFTNAYQVDKQGKARYSLASERGTILRVAPDLKSREIWCTGIRFPVGMATSPAGDLFCTDQEGATWLPNGNPLDELLHIQKGRHYGFPPRHPRHLPDIIDEPSTFDYLPQHQSTCGLCFNEPLNAGGPIFGPDWWRGDALVAGYTRGKIWRTKLVKGASGYLAQSQLIACLQMLTADVALSPAGDLVVACHSGGPDWGTGPSGKGKLYKIRYADRDAPQPSLVWCQSPQELRIAFDRPLDPASLAGLREKISIDAGPYVAAGDRFENLRPGYAVVAFQLAQPRHDLKVYGVALTPDQRTLVLATDKHGKHGHYAIRLPRPAGSQGDKAGDLPQHGEIDLGYDASGIDATWWLPDGQSPDWSGRLPTGDLAAARVLTAQSADHAPLWELMKKKGFLKLDMQFDLGDMLRPKVQPGSKIDYEWPEETVRLRFSSSQEFTLVSGGKADDARKAAGDEGYSMESQIGGGKTGTRDAQDSWRRAGITTGEGEPSLAVHWSTAEDNRWRVMPLHRFVPPWLEPPDAEKSSAPAPPPPELAGGDWLRGREVFFSEQALCFKCHSVGGLGGSIGPNLSNLRHRDYASVARDVAQPSYAINPDYITYSVRLTDGQTISGVVRSEGNTLRIGDTKGIEHLVAREDVEVMKAQPISTMPDNIVQTLPFDKLRDLMTFLLLVPPPELEPAPIKRPGAPPPRTRAEVEAVLAGSEKVDPARLKELKIVLVAGPKDHGESEHDYPDWQKRWNKLFSLTPKVKVETAEVWPSAEQLKTADVLVWYSANPGWSPERAKEIDEFQARGGGMVYLHFAVNGQRAPDQLAERIGLAWGASKFRHGPVDLKFAEGSKHPILRNITKAHFEDESYWNLTGDDSKITLLASGEEEGKPRPLLWTYERGKGRVFVSILGHYSWTFDDPLFRTLIFRGIAWTASEPVDRFNDLVPIGARIAD
jgi:putative heme-binding domain-containing protein